MSRTLALAPLAIALIAGPAAAQVVWTEVPTAPEMAAVFPAKAKAAGVGGVVEVICTTAASGALRDCDTLGEEPRGYGFGTAARKLASGMKAAGAGGREVRFTVGFPAEWTRGGPLSEKTPRWAALPSVGDKQAAVPTGEGGPNDVRVTLVCDVQAGGSLAGCVVDREAPAGQGFGQAILALAPKFRVEPLSADGTPTVGGKVRVPVRFDLKPVEQAAR